jgi:hypothetical protein
MKNIIITLASLVIIAFISKKTKAQCNDQLLSKSVVLLGEYTYLKDFRTKLKKARKNDPIPTAKYSVVLSKGTSYRIVTNNATEFPGKIILELYSQQGPIASNFDKDTNKFYETLDFTCKKSGLYYVVLSFLDGEEGCGLGLLGFDNKNEY